MPLSNVWSSFVEAYREQEGDVVDGEGEVSLHDTASVHGLVRYGRIQVNGADLNATLERAVARKPAS